MSTELSPDLKVRLINHKAKRARTNLVDFFEFVMREEATRTRMKAAAHQKVVFSFIQHPAHSKCVVILPIDHSKTFMMLTYALFQLAGDTGRRGLVMSKTQKQAAKIVTTMRQIIDAEPRLALVNPKMVRSRRVGDKWSDTMFTVQRGFGPKDPSFAAAGLDTAIGGYRLEFAIADDLLDHENTRTPERRRETLMIVDRMLKGRMLADSRLVFTNSTFHSADALNVLRHKPPRGPGFPALVMSADGNIHVYNEDPGWDTPGLYSASGDPTHFRLAENEPDDTLWPGRYSRARLEEKRREFVHDPGGFARLYMSATHDDSTAVCKQEFIDLCLEQARKHGAYGDLYGKTEGFAEFYGWRPNMADPGPYERYITITGVDLAVGQKDANDDTAFFTFECNRPDGLFRILDIEVGKWDAMTIAKKSIAKARRFKSALAVENNGAQNYLLDVIRNMLGTPQKDATGADTRVMEMENYIHVEALTTSETSKASPEYGLETMFYEMARGLWLIPNREGVMRREVADFTQACTEYTPTSHPADVLMAAHMGRRLASKWGTMARPIPGGSGGGIGSVMMR